MSFVIIFKEVCENKLVQRIFIYFFVSTSEENEDTRGDNDAVFTWELQPEVGLLLDG